MPVVFALIIFTANGSLAGSTSILYTSGVVSLEQDNVEIGKVYGIKIEPRNITINSNQKDVFIPHIIENLGNASTMIKVRIEPSKTAKGWSAYLVSDANGNGIHDWWEWGGVPEEQELGEGAVSHFLLKLTRPDNAIEGSMGYAAVKASCAQKGAGYYTGYNGIVYGGEDEVETLDTVIIK